MAFRFSLASVLRFREGIEKREELALQKVQLEVTRVRRHIDKLTTDLLHALDTRDEALQEPVPAHYLQSMQVEMDAAIEAKRTLSSMFLTLKHQRDQQMNRYQGAHSNRQMLTDLFVQKKNAWEQDQLRAQQKQLDDIFASRSQRH